MILFFNTMAVIFAILMILKIGIVVYECGKPDMQRIIKIAEMLGGNPIGNMIGKPLVILLVCSIWLICQLFS